MSLFRVDSVVLAYSDLEAAKQWWIDAFECKPVKVPDFWDNSLPSDIALKLPGFDEPTILLCSHDEVEAAHIEIPSTVPIIFANKLKKAQEYLTSKGVAPGAIQGDGETQFFEVRDLEGHVIEICKEP